MEFLHWVQEGWFEILQTVGIMGGLLFTAYTIREEARSRRIANLLAINEQYREIWKELYTRPELFRVLRETVNLTEKPITDEEWLFVKTLVLHLDSVHRAKKEGMYVNLEGLEKDVKEFFSLPIPRANWEWAKKFQDQDFVEFIENTLK